MPSFLLVHRQVSLGQNHKTAGQVAATGSKVLKIHILHKIEKQAHVSSTCVHVLFMHTPLPSENTCTACWNTLTASN